MPYVGRFAPSPTGALHFGSLIAAVASWVDARVHDGRWLVRIEDVDAPRCKPEHEVSILKSLEAHALHWDGDVVRQSDAQRQQLYAGALERLKRAGQAYACACSRKEIADSSIALPNGEAIYPGTCRNGLQGRSARAWRVLCDDVELRWRDRLFGAQRSHIARECGDFVVRRADDLYAYQLAVVVDDAEQGITDVVRGADLLDSTPRQLWLQCLLGYAEPRYLHLPVAANAQGEKLSKQTRATRIDDKQACANLRRVASFLNQQPPAEELREPARVLNWMRAHWDVARIQASRAIAVD